MRNINFLFGNPLHLFRKVLVLCMLLMIVGIGNVLGTTVTLKVWNHSTSAYYTYGTFETGNKPGDGPMLGDGYAFYSVVAWAPGEQTDIVHPNNSGADYYGQYAWPNATYSGAATTLYAVYYCQADDAGDYDVYWTTKPSYNVYGCENTLVAPSGLSVNTNYESAGNIYVRFSWTPGSGTTTNATNQEICYGLVGDAGTCVSNLSKSATYTGGLRSNLSNGEYWWKVRAIGDGEDYCNSDYTNGGNFCIDDIKSATPGNINAAVTSNTTATITWDAVSDASYYAIDVKNNSTGVTICSDYVMSGTTYNATGLTTNAEYRVELQAFNACDEASVKSTSYTFTIAEYTVHWYVNGELWEGAEHGSPATSVLAGNRPSPLPTAPTVSDACGDAFMGWTDHEIIGSSGQPSPLFKVTAPITNENKTFYAVFADEQP